VAYSLADLQARLAAIDAQILRPDFVQFNDRSERSRPYEALQQERQRILADIASLNRRPRQFQGVASKGLSCS
jgi:hypothetical protein